MSELADLTAPPGADVLPGYTLSPFRLWQYAEAETEFARAHVALAGAAAVGMPSSIQEVTVRAALQDVAEGKFNYGADCFDRKALAQGSTPYLLWLCLRPKHPKITRPAAEALITPENEEAVYREVLLLMGYPLGRHKGSGAAGDTSNPKATPAGTGGPSGGETSSPPSASADSSPPTSENSPSPR